MQQIGTRRILICGKNWSFKNICIFTKKQKIMRFRITMNVEGKNRVMPINYQYEMMSAIYSVLENADSEYARMLHDEGYSSDIKRFKLFCFSNLIAPYRGISPVKVFVENKEYTRLKVKNNKVYWYIGFALPEGMQKFVQGIFSDQQIRIADSLGGVTFKVVEVQLDSEPEEINGPIECQTLSPICVSKKVEGKSTVAYISPSEEGYEGALLTGLLERYKALNGKEFEGDRYCKLTVLGNETKSKLITIKADTAQQTKVKGFTYNFNIELPHELFKIAYNCGLGEKCGMGFGMIEVVKK